MEDCENIKFYSPEDTFGGVVKPQVCFTSTENVPQDLKEPTDVVDIEVIYDPKAIHIYNKEVTVNCSEDTVPNQFSTITIAANTEKDVIFLQEITSIPQTVLEYIAKNNLEEVISDLIKDRSLGVITDDNKDLAEQKLGTFINITKLTRQQALQFISRVRLKQETLDKSVELLALSQLECYYLNDPVNAICPGIILEDLTEDQVQQALKDLEEYAVRNAVTKVTIPYGEFKSYLSKAEANTLARNAAISQLNCYFENDTIIVSCLDEDRPDRPVEWDLIDVEDLEPVQTYTDGEWLDYQIQHDILDYNVPRPVGEYKVNKGTFTSYTSKEESNTQATEYAYSLLNCIYLNDEYTTECEDKQARFLGVPPTEPQHVAITPDKGQVVRAYVGYTTSLISTEDANNIVKLLAESLLECCFINPRITKRCPTYIELDLNGVPTGKTTDASYREDPEYEPLVIVPEGMFSSCTSYDEVIQMAETYAATMLEECYYCNDIVPPSCVPQWVTEASTNEIGVVVEVEFTDKNNNTYRPGDLYKLPLPLDYTNIYNPYTGLKENVNQWSVDATLGYPASTLCVKINEVPQLGDLIVTITPSLKAEQEACTYSNDLIVAGCKLSDPYANSANEGNTTPYIFITKFQEDDDSACISDHISYPATGSYIEVPAGTFTVSEYDLPRTKVTEIIDGELVEKWFPILPGEDGYSSDQNMGLVKKYANDQAIAMATSMLECVFSNPETIVTCNGEENTVLCNQDQWSFVSTGGLLVDPDRPYYAGSNTVDNPIVIPPDTFTSYISKQDVFDQTYAFGMSLVQCQYGNLEQECDCIELGRATDKNHKVVIPENTFVGLDPDILDQQAKDLACSLVVCFKSSIGPPGPIGPAGPPGPQGPPGANGQPGGCSGTCHGVYT